MMGTKLLAGAEPLSAPGGPHGALVLHGFTGSPQSVRELGRALNRVGFAVELPRLPGHGTSVEDMATTGWADWSAAVETAYAALKVRCERVVVVGLSMGGALALWLAAAHPEVAGIVAINPLVDDTALTPARQAAREALAAGVTILPGVGNDIAKPGVTEVAYERAPASSLISGLDGVAELGPRLGAIRTPLLLVHSLQDHVIPPSSSELLEASYGGPIELLELERSFHVATLDYEAEEIERRSIEFALRVVGKPDDLASNH